MIIEELAALSKGLFFRAVGQKAEVTDAHEAIGQDVEQKAADEFFGIEGHRFQPVFISAVAVAKTDLAIFDGEDTIIGKCHAVSVAAKVVEDSFGGAERLFRVDHPVLFAQLFESLAWGRDFSLGTGLL